MSRITRWDPFRDVMSMRRQMDQIMDQWLSQAGSMGEGSDGGNFQRLALDVSENDEQYTVRASVPGMQPEDLDINFHDGTLTIRGERDEEQTQENERWHLRERRYGSFQRSISLPSNVDEDKIDARYENGVLTLTLPKREETKPRRISVQGDQGGTSGGDGKRS